MTKQIFYYNLLNNTYPSRFLSKQYPNKGKKARQVYEERGKGPRHREFSNGDKFTEMLKSHEHVETTRGQIAEVAGNGQLEGNNPYNLGGIQGVGKYLKDYSTLATGGQTGNLAVTYLGSYNLQWKVSEINEGVASVTFTVKNSSTMQSASRPPVLGYLPFWQKTAGSWINRQFSTGVGSRTTQTFNWTETIKLK